MNHLGIELGSSVDEIFKNLEAVNFNTQNIIDSSKLASDGEY